METINKIKHQRLALKSSYEDFTQNIEKVLNRLEPEWTDGLAEDPEGLKAHLNQVAGSSGLMIFGEQQHGRLLALYGKPQKAIQYTIGNPLTAMEMTSHDIRAALYAPVRIIIYQANDGLLYAEYDLPSSQFGQFGNEVFTVAKGLDKKLEEALRTADKYGDQTK